MKIKLLMSTGVLFLCMLGFRGNAASFLQQDTTRRQDTTTTPAPATAAPQNTAQQKRITGLVVDEQSKPLPGVGVKSASNKSTVTDATGKFSIMAAPTEMLSFSYIGYTPVTRAAGSGNAPLSVRLVPDAGQVLENVTIVGVGYGTLDKREVTSSVAHLDSADFRQSGARSPLDLIQGKVAGLQLTRTGGSNPNSGVNIQLRGVVTTRGSASPLFVIDGIPGANPDLLQQDDIASIDVLKDGSGAAIYGTSANAGVIIITTKKGKSGPPQFNYNSYFRKEYVYNRPDFLTASEYREKINSGQLNREDYGNNTDFWSELINKNNFSQYHNLSLTGGTDKTNYRGSINYRNLEGIALENGREEYTLRLNINQKGLDDRLNVQMNLASNFNNANLLGGGGWESEATKNPTLSNFNPDGSYRFNTQSTNEYARLFLETNYRKQQTSSADIKADIDFFQGLKGTVFGSVQRNNYMDANFRMLESEDSQENSEFPGGGYARRGDFLSQAFAFEPTLQYDRTFAERHKVTVLGGYSYRYYVEEGQSADNRGFINNQFGENNLSEGTALSLGRANMDSFKNDNTLIAFFGRVNYSFNNKYLLQFILRHEGSSRFGANNKWANFPAVSAGWNISNEDFLKDVEFIDYLKLRAGFGVTGNSGFANYASILTLGPGGRYIYPDEVYRETYGPDRNPNADLQWEEKQELNVGLDFTLFNTRLNGSLDVFNRTTKNLLDTYATPQPPFIRGDIYTNVGQISARGIELALSYKALQRENFSWNMDVTASTIRNRLDTYSNSQFTREYIQFGDIGGAGALGQAIITYQGGPLGEFWGKRFAGFTDDGKWLFFNSNGEAVRNDQINNSPDINNTDLAPIGNAIPKYYASWTNTFQYRDFDLRIFVRGRFDYDILNTTALSYGNRVSSGNLLRSAFTKYNDINDTFMYSDYYLEEGSHVKIDEITLGYNLRLKSKFLRNIRMYVTGQNLATITGYSGNDPDLVSDTGLGPGIDSRGPYPTTRSFLFGLNVGF